MSDSFEISLDYIEDGLILYLDERSEGTLHQIPKEEIELYNEAEYQLTEGFYYDYKFSKEDFSFADAGHNIVRAHKRSENLGTLAPNIYTGTLTLKICKNDPVNKEIKTVKDSLKLEIRSLKTSYRKDYRTMLEYIAEKTADLLLQANAPTTHSFEVDPNIDSKTLYQRFSFLRSILDSDDFREAVNRIITYPVTRWDFTEELKDISRIKKFSRKNIRELTRSTNRTILPDGHPLKKLNLNSVPTRISDFRKTDSADTPENRFVKYALEEFLNFLNQINRIAKTSKNKHDQLAVESGQLIAEMELHLGHNLFREVSRPHSLNLNSPALQRKEGYREVLRVWLLFDLAAKLVWKGGDDVYEGGKKDVATLYEYWLFFKLLEVLEGVFEINPKGLKELIKSTDENLMLNLKQGKFTALKGIYKNKERDLNIRFCYNRTFSAKGSDYPSGGSWTTSMRPDYTLSMWPKGMRKVDAEEKELIVHIHFDAKYKVERLTEIIPEEPEEKEEVEKILSSDKEDNRKGVYKRADLLKMHAYKDAIRRTGGAYVLYPGSEKEPPKRGFHEIIPGLGAFPVKPSGGDDGTRELSSFIKEVVDLFVYRASQREKQAYHTYKIHKERPDEDNFLREVITGLFEEERESFPDESNVIIGYYRNKKHWDWIEKNQLYNIRIGKGEDTPNLDTEFFNAKYLILRGPAEKETEKIFKITAFNNEENQSSPATWTRKDLMETGYPISSDEDNRKNNIYLVYKIEEKAENEFKDLIFNMESLLEGKNRRERGNPFIRPLHKILSLHLIRK